MLQCSVRIPRFHWYMNHYHLNERSFTDSIIFVNMAYEWAGYFYRFQIWARSNKNWLKLTTILHNFSSFGQSLAQSWFGNLPYQWVYFSWKINFLIPRGKSLPNQTQVPRIFPSIWLIKKIHIPVEWNVKYPHHLCNRCYQNAACGRCNQKAAKYRVAVINHLVLDESSKVSILLDVNFCCFTSNQIWDLPWWTSIKFTHEAIFLK